MNARLRAALETIMMILFIGVAAGMLYTLGLDIIGRPTLSAARSRRPAPAWPPAMPQMPRVAPLPAEPLSLDGATVKGNPAARVAMIEYADLQCPYCVRFALEILPELDKRFIQTGQVLFAFRHLPLDAIHPLATKAAEAIECAGRQGKFWEMHDRLFRNPSHLEPAGLRESARTIRLDRQRFDRCLDGEMTEKVRTDAEGARALGVSGTPTFFIGTRTAEGRVQAVERLIGAQPAARIAAILEGLLSGTRQ